MLAQIWDESPEASGEFQLITDPCPYKETNRNAIVQLHIDTCYRLNLSPLLKISIKKILAIPIEF